MITFKTIKLAIIALGFLAVTDALSETQKSNESGKEVVDSGALSGHRHRVVISSDIGGTDPDDFQSMVHLLVYADVLDIEGIISSPFDKGRKKDILRVIDCYEKDYANLKTYSAQYPTPDALRAITKQGETERAPYAGVRRSTEGSKWIIECARRDDRRPLHVLVWGLVEDLAQALHDAPDILPKLRVYWIGGPNKKWSPDAYQYIVDHHPDLWIIESNATYRGWFAGGNQSGPWGNREFVKQHIAGKGALSDFFVSKKGDIKMGDTPSVGWLLKGTPEDPSQPGWGGQFVRAWKRPYSRLERMTTKKDRMEVFGILELVLPIGKDVPEQPEAMLAVENQKLPGHTPGDGTMRFRFCPKAAKGYSFKVQSNVNALDGKTGGITAYLPSLDKAQHPAANLPNWWTDDPRPDLAEESHHGAKTVNRWREDYLGDFAQRMVRCQLPAPANPTAGRLRVIMSSDFPPIGVVKGGNVPNTMKSDPDDMQSMVRFLLYANEFDIEGLIASAGTFAMQARKENILGVLDRYEMVYENLKSHDPDYPTADTLRSVTFEGLGNNHGVPIKWGHNKQPVTEILGEGKDSEASNAIIAAAGKPDPRPLWIGVWGGPREVAQAIWDVKNTRNEQELKAFISKLRVFLIGYQDATHGWLMNEFPDLFIIDSRKTYQGMFGGRDSISNLVWINENVRKGHGPLCDIYPHEGMGCTGVCEGDSPTFMYLVSANRGINNPEDPTQPSWGGQYKHKPNTNHYVDGPGGSSISRWRKDFQKEFAKRADWCVTPRIKKPRIINTTDLGADPDDEQSMVRFLVCSNEFDTEGLIVSTGCWKKNQSSTAMLDKIINAYAEVYDNLKAHADGYPTPEYLKSISVMGQRGYGMGDVGAGKDSPGSELIIASVDKDDPRPVWVGGWGGVNNVAQAVWKVQKTRPEAELKRFISKLRVFDILGQDDAGAWLAKNFPDLFYIRATGVYGWQPPKNGSYQREDIQSHGSLGAVYPNTKWATEGDTPAFMHVYPNGLNDPDRIDQGGWGGRFSFAKQKNIRSMSGVAKIQKDGETRFDPYYMYGNTPEKANAIKRWNKGYNNDFAARMDWTMTNEYVKANHHPVAVVNGDTTRRVLEVSASPGTTVTLDATGSSDPDGNSLVYAWSFYEEPSSYSGSVPIKDKSSHSATVKVPSNAGGKNIHMILELHDNGSPNLYAYRRVIINVQ